MKARALTQSLCALLLLSLGLACSLSAREAAAQLRREAGRSALILDSALSLGEAEELAEREAEAAEPLGFALWTELGGQVLEAPDLGRSVAAAVLPVYGNTRLVLPLAAGLGDRDPDGCLLDADTARRLFGSANASGATLVWQGRKYTVRGVFDSPSGAMLVRPDAGRQLDRAAVEGGAASVFAMRHSLSRSATVSGRVLHETARLFCGAPALLGLLLCGASCGRCMRASYGLPVRTAFWGALTLAAGTASFLLALALLPSPLLPSRWSDFAHWAEALRTAGGAVAGWLGAAWYRPDLRLFSLLARSALGLVAGQCLLIALRCLSRAAALWDRPVTAPLPVSPPGPQ